MKLVPLNLGDRILVQDRTMTSPQEAEVIAIYKRTVRIRFLDGQEKVIHRKYVLEKMQDSKEV